MTQHAAHTEPLSVEACEGEVVVRANHGPFAISLTPNAAEETAARMAEAARQALAQALQGQADEA